MTPQPSLFDPDPTAAHAAREHAIDRAGANADPDWRAAAHAAIEACAASMPGGFTADHVWEHLAAAGAAVPHQPAALGAVFRQVAAAGRIGKTGEQWPSTHRRRHRDLTVWAATSREDPML